MAARSPARAAGLLERVGREFNYPGDKPRPQRRRLGDATAATSASAPTPAAAWSNAALDADRRLQADPGLRGDDRGRRAAGARASAIAYVAEAMVEHAHRLRPRGRLPPPVRHRLQPPPLRLAAARRRGRRGRVGGASPRAVLRRACARRRPSCRGSWPARRELARLPHRPARPPPAPRRWPAG